MAVALACWLAGPALVARALAPGRPAAHFRVDRWGSEHGLPSNSVLALLQSSDGYLWLGTPEGLVRFDGMSFTLFDRAQLPGLQEVSARCLTQDASGALWIGSDRGGGVARWNRADGSLRAFAGARDGLAHHFVRALAVTPGGAVFVGTAQGLSEFRGGTMRAVRASGLGSAGVRALALRGNDQKDLYVGTAEGVLLVRGEVAGPAGGATGPGPRDVRTLLLTREGALWAGTGSGLHRFEAGAWSRIQRADGLPSESVAALASDQQGNLWVGTTGGLARVVGGKLAPMPLPDEHAHLSVLALLEDRQGTLWVGTERRGLLALRDGAFTHHGRHLGLQSGRASAVAEDASGAIWVGTSQARGSLVRVAGGRGGPVAPHEVAAPGPVTAMASSGQALLVAAGGALVEHRPAGFESVAAPANVRQVVVDGRGRRWVASPSGVFLLTPAGPRPWAETRLPQPRLLYAGPSGVWVASDDAVGRIDADTLRVQTLHRFGSGLAREEVTALHEDPGGDLWIATLGGGLKRLRGQQVTTFTARQGLPSDRLYQIVPERAGPGARLWLSSSRGLFVVDAHALEAVAAGRAPAIAPRLHGTRDGIDMTGLDPGVPAGLRGRDGTLWFVTGQGLVATHPDRPTRADPTPVLIEQVTLDGVSVPVTSFARGVAIAADARRLEIRYAGLSLASGAAVRFRHRLEGLDRGWVDAGSSRTAAYAALAPGRYRFVVSASNEQGMWNPAAATVALRVLPPWWRTVWFLAGLSVAVLGLVLLLHWLRLRRVAARHQLVLEERGRIAREIHDALSQGLVAITTQIDCAGRAMSMGPERIRHHLEQARAAASETLDEARRSVWSLRPGALAGADLPAALNALAAQMEGARPIRVEVKGQSRRLPDAVEDTLLRVAGEAITNAIKHAHADEIAVTLGYAAGSVRMEIVDDGQGFASETPSGAGGAGLPGMRARLARVAGSLQVTSRPGAGTTIAVEVRIPS